MHYVAYNLINDDEVYRICLYSRNMEGRPKNILRINTSGRVPGGCGGTEITEADGADASEITMPVGDYWMQDPNVQGRG